MSRLLPTALAPFTALMPISGTYDVLTVPVLLPSSTVASLLPLDLRDNLLPIPDDVLAALGLDDKDEAEASAAATGEKHGHESKHLVVLQCGRQLGTGPGPMSLNFQEAKLEVPYVRHPDCPDQSKAFSFKLVCIFDSRVLCMGSAMQAGLTSKTTSFTPTDSPSCSPTSSASISYSASGYMDVEATAHHAAGKEDGARVARNLSEMAWFGAATPRNTASRFKFDEAKADVYDVKATLHLNSVSPEGVQAGDVQVQGLGFRTTSHFTTEGLDVRKSS